MKRNPDGTWPTPLVVCESADGWSLHAPGSTDEAIARGDSLALASGPWVDDEHDEIAYGAGPNF